MIAKKDNKQRIPYYNKKIVEKYVDYIVDIYL